MLKKIFITGRPGVGKTTLIKRLSAELSCPKYGFYTQEIRNTQGRRTGFQIKNFNSESGILASVDISSEYQVGKYNVNLDDLNRIGVAAIERGLTEKSNLFIIDEIGKMELFSTPFRAAVQAALDAENPLVATVKKDENPFGETVQKRADGRLYQLTPDNREKIYHTLVDLIKTITDH